MGDIVIGSGPAGVSVATALLARGRRVQLIDGGKELEAERAQRRAALAARAPSDWSRTEREIWTEPQFHAPEGQVRRFGSDFAMEPARETLASPPPWFALRASRAVGGLSNLWGAAVLPYRQADMAGWPIGADDLAPHYRAVAGFMPIAGQVDDLQAEFPALDMQAAGAMAPGVQGAALLERLGRARGRLARMGVRVGAARVAVGPGCTGCGMCLHGCPWGLIWSAGQQVAALNGRDGFSYQQGRVAQGFRETGDGVEVTLAGGDVLRADRLFIAAGVLETARLLLRSGVAEDLELRDSQHGFLPLIQRWRTRARVDRMPLTTLPQLFAELDAPDVSPHLVHAQLYTWNEFFARDLIANYGFGLPPLGAALRALARRLVVAQVFLHSDHSARIALRLAPDGRLAAELRANPDTGARLKRAQTRIGRALAAGGLIALGPASRPGAPGSSFHLGASLAMARRPGARQSDVLGRPQGLTRVHVVDASVLPEIPAATITFSVMANAHRIGSLAP